jgi:SAM-dependent methyltransferase
MDRDWDTLIWPLLTPHRVDLSSTMELACGYGRNSRKLLQAGANKLTLVDANAENIEYCRQHIKPLGDVTLVQNNGIDLSNLPNDSFSFVYTFDFMVHFDLELVISYIVEFSRVLKPGGTAFIHHSNYTGAPDSDFRQNPHWRNFMSKSIIRYLGRRNSFEVVEERLIPWGNIPYLDCLSLLRSSYDQLRSAGLQRTARPHALPQPADLCFIKLALKDQPLFVYPGLRRPLFVLGI